MPNIEKIKGKAEGKPPTKRFMRGMPIEREEMGELELTPFMNILLILIPFLAAMAIFTHLAVIDFSLPPAASAEGGDAAEPPTEEMDISIVITENAYTVVGSGQKLPEVVKTDGRYNFSALAAQLRAIKFKYPSQQSIILVIEPKVLYDDIVHFMDKCRENQFPSIALSGGFQ